ncbi:phosphodiester glycosidase family protein [Aliiglaciecola sp. 2_MG-2023]|uniref:phosphodiester glycosidase family protein n=1 Tax=unclassified Aliiglaciecola TaxID=2593648 RepID=UPI0026E18186|nr:MULTISPECIES: phosphodiester glycosidase family protein [unclassified Aliiglaciecola]MDO6711848.1 phosphodiester glycosidase family protein [Aliiglaciecola sp. 2_MG-2023]MDO6752978.1 phosphodiester glycosidase family protein [Aliiglaciecola sp. 1_MG-2023]
MPVFGFSIRCFVIVCALLVNACSTPVQTKTGLPVAFTDATQTVISPGLSYFKVDRGELSGYFELTSSVMSVTDANALVDALNKHVSRLTINSRSHSLKPKMIDLVEQAPDGSDLGKLVTIGQFNTLADAQIMQQQLAAIGLQMRPSHSTQRSGGMGKQEISILKLVPSQYTGTLTSSLAKQQITGVEKVSEIAKKNLAVAAVNGGFFAFNSSQGIIGDVAGLAVIDGILVSEAVAGRPALLINNQPSLSVEILNNVQSQISLTVEDKNFYVDGINRLSGKIFNCGFGHPKVVAIHDFVCHKSNEIIVYNHYFGNLHAVLSNREFHFFVDQNNSVYFNRPDMSTSLPVGHRLVVASGDSVSQLEKFVSTKTKVVINQQVTSDSGELTLRKGMYVINGGPTLLVDGKQPISQRRSQGWGVTPVKGGTAAIDHRDDISEALPENNRINFYQNWVLKRHPRTAVGVTNTGDVYVVVVYGRDPFKSIGASITEMSELMLELGVQKAINLDGGGSSVMVVNGQITGKPSDSNGERAVAEALLFTAK